MKNLVLILVCFFTVNVFANDSANNVSHTVGFYCIWHNDKDKSYVNEHETIKAAYTYIPATPGILQISSQSKKKMIIKCIEGMELVKNFDDLSLQRIQTNSSFVAILINRYYGTNCEEINYDPSTRSGTIHKTNINSSCPHAP